MWRRCWSALALLEQRLPVQLDPGPAATLHADPDQLEQMFINCWPMRSTRRWPTARSRCASDGGLADSTLLVAIEDRGLGIANAENLFVPFYTTKPTGSGVGLALAQQIARAHGGEIRLVNREDGEGARAIVRFPLA